MRDGDIAVLAFTPDSLPALTDAEARVALAIARGMSNAEIARAVRVSVRTVANQVAAILKKLGVSSRAEIAATLGIADLR